MVRADAGQVRLTERDLHALVWIGAQWAVRLDQLQTVLGTWGEGDRALGEKATEQVLIRWRRAGWVASQKILARQPS